MILHGARCYICTQALHWKTKEGLVRMCACRGTAGRARVVSGGAGEDFGCGGRGEQFAQQGGECEVGAVVRVQSVRARHGVVKRLDGRHRVGGQRWRRCPRSPRAGAEDQMILRFPRRRAASSHKLNLDCRRGGKLRPSTSSAGAGAAPRRAARRRTRATRGPRRRGRERRLHRRRRRRAEDQDPRRSRGGRRSGHDRRLRHGQKFSAASRRGESVVAIAAEVELYTRRSKYLR